MSILITLDDALAEKLTPHAQARDVSVEEYARQLLVEAAENGESPNAWSRLQTRRMELIAKEHATELSGDELSELEALQQAAAKVSQPADRALLERLSRIETAAGRFLAEADD